MYATALDMSRSVQFKVKLNESEKIEKRKMTPNEVCFVLCCAVLHCSALYCANHEHSTFKVNVEWIFIHAISTKALPF